MSRLPVGSSASSELAARAAARARSRRAAARRRTAPPAGARRGRRGRPARAARARAARVAASRRPRDQRRQQHVLDRGQRRQQVEELEDEADVLAAQAGQRAVVEAVVAPAADRDAARASASRARRAMCSSVLLPEPDGPMIATNSPGRDRQVDAVERADGRPPVAEDLHELAAFEAGHDDDGRAGIGRGAHVRDVTAGARRRHRGGPRFAFGSPPCCGTASVVYAPRMTEPDRPHVLGHAALERDLELLGGG